MKTIRTHIATAALVLAGILPAAAQQPAPGPDVLAQPSFKAIAQDLSPTEGLLLAAHINIVLRQYERAIPMFEALLKTSPNRADLWAGLAVAYNRADEPREALDAANIAITLAPHYPHFYVERGIARFRLGQHAESIADLEHYVKAFPQNGRAHFYLGLARAARGDTEAARVSLLRARMLTPSLSLAAEYYLGLIAAGRGQMAMSKELLARTHQALEGSELPVGKLVAEQMRDLDGDIARRIRAAVHEADARVAHQPGAPASR